MTKEQIEVLNFQNQRVFACLSRNVLCVLEDLKRIHEINFDKLKNNLPEDCAAVVDMSDYLNDEFFQYYRKKILDIIQSGRRDLDFSVNDFAETN